ncbi:MAG: DUF423 domain-containing protein [Acidithiobacillus sp.]|uniref:DUF423 domain-containing protein n=1 Tax=Acidithiobacillus sp. TaxID=1872118 RepID=UPI003D02C71F
MKPGNVFVAWGGFLAALAMALGAVGSHLLQGRLSPALMNIYHIANQFQIYHALGLILVGILMQSQQGRSVTLLRWAGWIMLLGIFLFCGGLTVLTLTGWMWMAILAPFGGTAFIVAWILVGVGALRG